MTRILVTGASGMLGSNLVLQAQRAGLTVIASSLSRVGDQEGITWVQANLTDPRAAGELIKVAAPDWVVNCAAATDVDDCEKNAQWAFSTNRDIAHGLAAEAKERGLRMIHISTDAVFSGENGPNSENDLAEPVNIYGESKLAGEAMVASTYPEATIVRTNFYGWSPAGRVSLAEWFLAKLQNGDRTPGFKDVRVNPLLVNDLADHLFDLLSTNVGGVLHIAARDCISKYEFGLKVARVFGLDDSVIEPVSAAKADLIAKRPKHLCLAFDKVERDLDITMQTVDEGLQRMAELDQSGYRMQVARLLSESRKVPG